MISTGSQGEPMSALSLMATGDNKRLQIERRRRGGDQRPPHPGQRVVGRPGHRRAAPAGRRGRPLGRRGGARERPRPPGRAADPAVGGPPRLLRARSTASTATWSTTPRWPRSMGVAGRPGAAVRGRRRRACSTPTACAATASVPAGYLYVDGTVGDVGHGVLRDRRVLAEEGVVMVVATVDLHRGQVVSAPADRHPGLGARAGGRGAARRRPARWWPTPWSKAMADGARDVEVLQPPRPQVARASWWATGPGAGR